MTTDPQPNDGRCSVCGSPNLGLFQGDYPTGVVAPDGGQETRRQIYVYCHNCGSQEEL